MAGRCTRLLHLSRGLLAIGGLFSIASCSDPSKIDTSPLRARPPVGTSAAPVALNEDCPAGDDWLPQDGGLPPPVQMFTPPPHPDTECPFYRGAYQNFLIAAAPLPSGDPALVNYATLDDAFTSSYNMTHKRNTGDSSADPYGNPSGAAGAATVRMGPPTGKAWLGAVRQAGQRNILIDQDSHTLYYGLHMNLAFVEFIREKHLDTVNGILNVDPNLEFPPGLVEFKTAWKDIDPHDFPDSNGRLGTPDGKVPPPNNVFASDPGDYSNYITTMAWIPWLIQDAATHQIKEDPDHPVLRKMALVAIHCVYTLPGHPEFVWGSIQHVNVKEIDPAPVAFAGVSILGAPDSQPDTLGPNGMPALPDEVNDPQNAAVLVPPSMNNYLLFRGGTPEKEANKAILDPAITLDEASQSFMGQRTSVYRMFPGSKSNKLSPDSAVFSLNSNINVLFDRALAAKAIDPGVDKRQHYRLVAATWMDKPYFFGLGPDGKGMSLQNDDTSPLVIGAKTGNIYPNVSQGTSCGTPRGPNPVSGDSPNADGTNNTVPGCVTRADSLDLPGALAPVVGPDGGRSPVDPSSDFSTYAQGTDSEFSILGGEDRLSSTAMETFTQNGTFHNCFSCHNTQPITVNGTPVDPKCKGPACPQVLIPTAAKLNVSHLFSEFVLREQEAKARAAGN